MTRISPGTTAWAVYLGCTDCGRLAREWGITKARAGYHLSLARSLGYIEEVRYMVYRCKDPRRPMVAHQRRKRRGVKGQRWTRRAA